jgi:ABC-2 type transport system ATP-binding protein
VEKAVTVQELVRLFGTHRAVDGMTWSAAAGQVTAVLGPNGAGKTTSIECAEGLQRPDGGAVRVLGQDPWRASADHRARVGVMLQDGGLPNSARPLPLLRHLSSLYAAPADLEGDGGLVARLGIGDFGGTSVRRLSGGQRQRVALAAALVGRPEVTFLDEPSAGLDPHARLDVWDLVREVADAGAAVVLTTHSFEEAERLADHIVVVAAGRVVAEGTLAEVTAGQRLEDRYFALTRKAVA